jgi:site-specific DNA-methyltransferase (adenine-specific)/modification methylase
MKPTPFYEKDGITIYHGDCAKILPFLDPVDLLLTDPPYGIGESDKKNASRGKLAKPRDYGVFNWDKAPISQWLIESCISKAKASIIFGGNYYLMPPSSCWLIWDKENSGDFADGEMAWTNLDKALRIKRHQWNGFIRVGNEDRYHPTQKPAAVMTWAIQQAGEVSTILDPFMGSGTTLVAARSQGKRCIGIERELKYCEIAVSRLAQNTLFQIEEPNVNDNRAGEQS